MAPEAAFAPLRMLVMDAVAQAKEIEELRLSSFQRDGIVSILVNAWTEASSGRHHHGRDGRWKDDGVHDSRNAERFDSVTDARFQSSGAGFHSLPPRGVGRRSI